MIGSGPKFTPMKRKPTTFAKPQLRRGFTLVELLVVIVIVAALAAIGFPLANKMRATASEGKCMEQLRGWSSVFARYSADHAGTLECRNWNSIGREDPSAYVTYWTSSADESHEAGFQTLAKMRCCPSLKGAEAISGNGNSLTAYSMTDASGIASANAKVGTYNMASIKTPSRFVIMIETLGGKSFISTPADYTSRVKPLTTTKKRHDKGVVNAIFGDYSVQSLSLKDIEKGVNAWTTF
jgi:prepilin-type N-terminal cleavage/methylation domain-containing protein